MKSDITVITNEPFNKAVDNVIAETEKAGFKVLHIHDVKNTLGKKGYVIEPMKIIEICRADLAYQALQASAHFGLLLPCKINVYKKDKVIYISSMKPTAFKQLFSRLPLHKLFKEVELKIEQIILSAAK